jgi:hypothetical protein
MKLNKNFIHPLFIFFLLAEINMVTSAQKPAASKIIMFSDLKFIDIGIATKNGTEKFNNNLLEFVAGGSDIWGKHDEFHFGYKKLKGDFDLSVQILSLSAADKYTKAGIMARSDLSDSSQHVYYQVFPDNSARNKNNGGCEFQYRLEKGSEMKAIYPVPNTAGNQFKVSYPDTYIRLKRIGDNFEAYFSNDNKTWRLYTKFELKMPGELFVGLAVTAHNKADFTTAKFGSYRTYLWSR